jgi:tetratricopeptide (TPR) repeat protein
LLGTKLMPVELNEIVRQKAEGNPFYIEEMINSLIDSDILTRDNDSWKLSRKITDSDIPATIHGVLSARVDRLGKQYKRVLQEASVIGRVFLYEIIERITDIDSGIDQVLSGLENLDLIRIKTSEPKLEYIFKHALTQEVVYNGLLIRERKVIHERIGFVIEKLFHDRLPEFYETLALHFKHGQSVIKAVEYLTNSGQKSYSRYALEESHQYYKEAYDLLSEKDQRSEEENLAIIDMLIKWGHVHNGRADLMGLEKILIGNEELAKSIPDKERLGMFYAWLGFVLRCREKIRESYTYLIKALKLGEEISSKKIIGYSCAWLVWTCADMGHIDEGIKYDKRARELIDPLQSDGDFVRFTLNGLGILNYFRGDYIEVYEIGEQLLNYGQRHSDLRCMATGHNIIGLSHYVAGNYALGIESFHNSLLISADIIFLNSANLFLGITYVANEEFSKAEGIFDKIMRNSEIYGFEFMGTAAKALYGVILISQGSLNKGVQMLENAIDTFLSVGSMYRYAMANFIIGKIYARLAVGGGKMELFFIVKNISFLIRNIPLASKKTENYFNKAIDVSKKIGAKGILGQAYLNFGLFYKAKKKPSQAKEMISRAIDIFNEIKADVFLKQAKDALPLLDA